MYLYSFDDSLGKGNPCPNFSKIGVKVVLIDKWVKVLHKLKFYLHLNYFSHYIGLMPPRPAGYW